MFSGSIPALPTPFTCDGIDESALRDHVSWLIEEGSSGLVACGTTGEATSLSEPEYQRVLKIVVSEAADRVPVVAGCGTPSTATTLRHMRIAQDAGAAAAMVAPPYYVRPNQNGIIAHYSELARRCGLPIVIYNVPKRTGVDIAPETMGLLVTMHPGSFAGLKDATGAIERVALQRDFCGEELLQLSGNDETSLGFMEAGGVGFISVTANVAPALCAKFHELCRRHDYQGAAQINEALLPLHRALFLEASPAPLKYAMQRIRAAYPSTLRLPMIEIGRKTKAAINGALIATTS